LRGGYGEDGGEGDFSRPSPAFAALGGWEILEPLVAGGAVDRGFSLKTIPKATASFANFQIYVEFHDFVSVDICSPADFVSYFICRRAVGERGRRAGFFSPAGGWRQALLDCWSRTWRTDPGNSWAGGGRHLAARGVFSGGALGVRPAPWGGAILSPEISTNSD